MSPSSQPAWLQGLPRSNRPGSVSTGRSHLWQAVQASPKNCISLSPQAIRTRHHPSLPGFGNQHQLNVSNSNVTAPASIRRYETLGLEGTTRGHRMSFPCQRKQEQHSAQPLLGPFQRHGDKLIRKTHSCSLVFITCPAPPTLLRRCAPVLAPLWRVCPAQTPRAPCASGPHQQG